MPTNTSDRIGAATGAAFVVLIFVGNSMNTAGTSGGAHPTGEQVLRDVAHQASSTGAAVGLALEVLGFAMFMAFLGYLAGVLRRGNGESRSGLAAGTAVVSGVVMLAVKLGSAAPAGALFLDREHISPQLARVLSDMNGVAFVISWLPFAVFVAAAAAALRGAYLVGRPTAYIGLVLGAAGIALAVVGLDDPVGANPMAFLLGMLWLLVVSVRLAVRPGAGATADADLGAAASPVAVGV
jgi:hypothetical protein